VATQKPDAPIDPTPITWGDPNRRRKFLGASEWTNPKIEDGPSLGQDQPLAVSFCYDPQERNTEALTCCCFDWQQRIAVIVLPIGSLIAKPVNCAQG